MVFSASSCSYAELHCLSNFSFLRGASHPEELVTTAAELGYAGLAITDECSVAGVVRGYAAARESTLRFVVGSEIGTSDGLRIVVLAPTRAAYADVCDLISRARTAAPKGAYRVERQDLTCHLSGSQCLLLWLPGHEPLARDGTWLKERFGDRLWLAVEQPIDGAQRQILADAERLSKRIGLRMVASGNVHMHMRSRKKLQDTLTAIRLKRPLDRLGFDLFSNAERYLRPISVLEKIYPRALLHESLAILERIHFSLGELRYEYPREIVPDGESPATHLRGLTERGMRWRWPAGAPGKVVRLVEHELALIADLEYEPYFLTVYDIVSFARRQGILCQGRGSAANSAVCYCLGITEVDPASMELLVERFISKERNEPPDIDVDFEHERREEVIQYIYGKYSRQRAALAATVITYRPKSAIRDVGKALGLEESRIDVLAKSMQWWDGQLSLDERLIEAGFDREQPKIRQLLCLVNELIGFPRHLSQHVGGFVISAGPLSRLVPIENAAMPERTVIQWDKDDLETLGLLKVDILGLGMLSAIRRSCELLSDLEGCPFGIADVPPDDPAVYDMICRADTVGVFQIESRAQMAMLPRLKPRSYYDLVIEVAIIRPGPIQGDMVHPYLRRRNNEEEVTYPSEAVRKVLERTLGVPIFQEQVMQLAIVAAGFSAGEADQLRRAMAAWRRRGDLEHFRERLTRGMRERGYAERFSEQIFNQIKGFGEYGFPESHAASFALLAYVSAWLKHHEPAVFFCALLNSQPMGFYAPAQLIRCARDHSVEIGPVDVAESLWDSGLEGSRDSLRIRLGLRLVKGLSAAGAAWLVAARRERAFSSIRDLARRARLDARDLGALAAAGALRALSVNRYQARWQVAGLEPPTPLLADCEVSEALPLLGSPTAGESVCADYRHLGFSLTAHPLALLRERLAAQRICSAGQVHDLAHGERVRTAGLVITRQRPSSAAGVTFVTLEDETGFVNLIVWERVAERERKTLLGAGFLGVEGKVQRQGSVLHVIAQRLYDHTELLGQLEIRSRDFR